MTPPPEKDDPLRSGAPELDRLVLDYMERVEDEGSGVLDELCAAHPGRASRLRAVIAQLEKHGLGRSPERAAPPGQLGGFEILREVGRGGMGVVYEARELALDRRVAVKVMLAHLTHDERTVERFRREGRTVSSLQHPGIVQVYSVGTEGGHDFLVMEFIDGAPLDKMLSDASHLGPEASGIWGRGHIEQVVGLAARVADALHHAHLAGIIHRDVKPSNVLVRPDGTPVLTDFGLARREDLPGLTRSGSFAGTPAYMAPEQTRTSGVVDARTDVFSLGALLYELLTLRRPFEGDSSHELMRNIQTHEPVDPQKINHKLPSDLAAVVLKALEKDPRRRYRTAAAFADDLRAFLEYRPVAARRASAVERARRWVVRQPLRAALVAVIALAVPTVAGLAGVWFANRDKVAAAEAQDRRTRVDAAIDRAYMIGFGGEREQVMAELGEALTLEPANIEALAGNAMHLLRRGDGPIAAPSRGRDTLEFLAQHGEIVGRHRVLQRIRAWALRSTGNEDEARSELERLGEPSESLEAFWAGVHIMQTTERGSGAYLHALGYFLDAEMLAPRPRPAIYFYLGFAAGEANEDAVARRVARALQTLWPESFYAHRGAGIALYDIDPAKAVESYRRALEILDNTAVRTNLATALSRMGRSDEAVAEWKRVIATDPEDATPYALLGREYFARRGDYENAILYMRSAIERDADQPMAWHYLMWALSRTGQEEEALTAARAAVEALPDEPLMRHSLSNVLEDRGELEQALEILRETARLAPDHLGTYKKIAGLHEQLGRLDEAERAHELEIQVAGPNRDRAARYDLAVFLMKERDGERCDAPRARRIAQELVVETDAIEPWNLELLGAAELAIGEPEVALATYERAREVADSVEHATRRKLSERLTERIEKLKEQLAEN